MIATKFDASLDLIIVPLVIWGPHGEDRSIDVALDTGSAMTTILPEVTDALGYRASREGQITGVYSAVSKEQGYTLRVARVSVLGFEVEDFVVHAFDLHQHLGVQGLLGLDFLRRYNFCVLPALGEIRVSPDLSA